MNEVAVVTDAVSSEYFLPVWAEYYGRQFGRENLFVFSYDEKLNANGLGVANVLRVNVGFNENIRPLLFNEFVGRLLERYSCVIRTDADEFLAPDPRTHGGLKAFVAEMRAPYVTAQGLDVVEMADEPPLNFDAPPLLAQRRFAVKASAYSKTCIVKRPVRWGLGLHTIAERPVFDDLYLFHMKFADVARRRKWLEFMAETCRADEAHYKHFKALARQFEEALARFRGLPKREGGAAIRDGAFRALMEGAVERREGGQFDFVGIPTTDNGLCEIPGEFARLF